MISFLFTFLCTLVLFVGILIVLVGSVWILSVTINEALEVDILWKVKRKARGLVYGEKRKEETYIKNRHYKR